MAEVEATCVLKFRRARAEKMPSGHAPHLRVLSCLERNLVPTNHDEHGTLVFYKYLHLNHNASH